MPGAIYLVPSHNDALENEGEIGSTIILFSQDEKVAMSLVREPPEHLNFNFGVIKLVSEDVAGTSTKKVDVFVEYYLDNMQSDNIPDTFVEELKGFCKDLGRVNLIHAKTKDSRFIAKRKEFTDKYDILGLGIPETDAQ